MKKIKLVRCVPVYWQKDVVEIKKFIGGGWHIIDNQRLTVRRLTCIECERLMNLPDNYTLIDHKSCSKSARFKALGNGMAQNVANWIIKRIVEETECD